MPTQEERLAELEQKVADIELERLYEKRKAAESTSSEQTYDAKQVNYRLTMLRGSASGQEHDIQTIKNDLGIVRERVEYIPRIDQRLNGLEQRFTSLENKFEQVLQQLATITTKLDQGKR